jgi:FixJ family two-component response regulator
MTEGAPATPELGPCIWIVEDEPAAAALAVDLCAAAGAVAIVFSAALPFLGALRILEPPAAVVLDWRLEREVSAAIFLAIRHRTPDMPVVYWTGSPRANLPGMISGDGRARIVDKAAGAAAFEAALAWALARQPEGGAA